ncbi:MAG: HAMP domain-containing sensor histidine kinase [Opitutaceae bacterium]|nr:HAMP domain-containing sensor histidine kinase [Opitutaceae bacterium]
MPAVSPVSRRIFLYWLLLLVPTLVVGGGAVVLLQREQARLAERSAYADEARRAAMAARARLIVENVELLVGDVQTGLLDALTTEPAARLDDFLTHLEQTNPLVRVAFRAAADGKLLRPTALSGGENAAWSLRQFGAQPPWRAEAEAHDEKGKLEKKMAEPEARKEVSANVLQVQSARRDVQDLARNRSSYANQEAAGQGAMADAAPAAPASAAAEQSKITLGAVFSSGSRASAAAKSAPPEAKAASVAKDAVARDRRGWVPAAVDGRLRVVGWLQPGGAGEVRGVELELAAIISRLSGALPAEIERGDGYALRDELGRVLHQAGVIPSGAEPMLRVPLAAALLPGWEVSAYFTPLAADSSGGFGFFGLGVLLIGIFVAAILAGGSLLLWQARRSEEEAAQKTSFVANVSHEFKTPLTTIRLYAELLEQGRVRDAAQGSDYLRTIGRETQRLARLVNNALDFSRLEQGRKKYARDAVDLAGELDRVLDAQAPRLAEAGLVLRRDLPGTLPVITDRDAVEQIVLNLIDNACKYAADGGEIAVSAAAGPRGGAEVRVADRGPGVPAEHHERIFEKFHRVDDALTAEKTGAGLGLSIARQLARGLGGELRCAPRASGGAEFILTLP